MSEPSADAWSEWEQVKRIFLTLNEWFRDDTLHHLVGFLASREATDALAAIRTVASLEDKAADKAEFRRNLKAEIFSRVFYRGQSRGVDLAAIDLRAFIQEAIGALDYRHDSAAIRSVLLLFNLASLMESGARARFPFGAFKRDKWDIEHIRSVQSRKPERVDSQKRWLANVVEYLGGESQPDSGQAMIAGARIDLIHQAKKLVEAEKFDGEAFTSYFLEVQRIYDPYQDLEADNGIGNLTLLDAATNRGYGNAIFPIKRKTVIALDKVGKFVPLCTKNVFLKYYSRNVDRMLMWDRSDTEAHAAAIRDCLINFFSDGAQS